MDKLLLFPGKTDKGIFTYVIDAERSYLEKTAAEYHPTIASYINDAKPIKGKTQVLLTALGAGEWWSNNVNGDYFPETALAHPGKDYGYETFLHYAKVYRHHINKDPTRSYGDVVLSIYNPVYHRVELIVTINHDTASDIVSKIERGDYPDWSMGTKVPFDICNICGNKAPTRAQYCDHLRYYIGRIPPGMNKVAYAINTMPKFFDISLVLIGADRIAKTLKKVASPYGTLPIISSAYLAEKAAEQKRAEIEKEIPPNQPPASQEKIETLKDMARSIADVKSMEPPMPDHVLNDLAKHPLPKVLSTMSMLGIVPKPQEFQRIFLISSGHGGLADQLSQRNLCFDPMSVQEPSEDHYKSIDVGAHNFDDMIMQKLLPFMADRSYAAPHLGRRMVVMIKSGSEYPLPQFVKVGAEENERKPFGPGVLMLAAAGAYIALAQKAPKEALKGVDRLLSSKVGLGIATALGLGLIKTFNTVAGPNVVGRFSPEKSTSNPDATDIFSRIEEMKQKPFNKVGAITASGLGSAAKRLFLGIPAAYMASGVLQKHKELSPYDEEGRIRSFIRRNPDVISAALVADALLSAHGHSMSTGAMASRMGNIVRPIWEKAKNTMGGFAKAAMMADDICGTDLAKTADAQDFLSQALIWPLAMGKANLPGRIVGGLFDQAVIETGSKILEKRRQNKLVGEASKKNI